MQRKIAIVTIIGMIIMTLGFGQGRASAQPDAEVVIIVAPSVNDSYYKPVFDQVIAYDIRFVNTIRNKIEVRLVVDEATLPYVEGKIPDANIITGDVGDIWVRDFSPVFPERSTKFRYLPNYLPTRTAKFIDNSFTDWTKSAGLNLNQSDLIVDGGNFVHNGVDKAILTERIFDDNPNYTRSEIDAELRRLMGLSAIAYVPEEEGDTTGHSDGMVMWLDADTLIVNEYDEPFRSQVRNELDTAFPGATIIEIPIDYTYAEWRGFVSACGLHANSLVTDDYIIMPTYGQDNDATVKAIIEQHTDKEVITVNAEEVCFMGGAVRCLTWYAKGDEAAPFLASTILIAQPDFLLGRENVLLIIGLIIALLVLLGGGRKYFRNKPF